MQLLFGPNLGPLNQKFIDPLFFSFPAPRSLSFTREFLLSPSCEI